MTDVLILSNGVLVSSFIILSRPHDDVTVWLYNKTSARGTWGEDTGTSENPPPLSPACISRSVEKRAACLP